MNVKLQQKRKVRRGMYKVIIAEDELFVRLGIRMSVSWETLGMEVVADVENGQQALQAWEVWKPDIIITDIKMPLMDGISLVREIRKKDERTRFIILSCLEEFQIVREAISMGVTDYVLKLTMTQEDMEKVLRKAVKELDVLDGSYREKKAPEDKKQFEEELRAWLYYRLDMSPKRRRIIEEAFPEMPGRAVRMILLEIDRYQECKKSFNDSYGTILDSAAENILSELLEGRPHILLIEKEGRSVLILSETAGEGELPADTEKLLDHIREVFGRYLGSTVTFAVSRPGKGYEEFGTLFHQCSFLLEKKFFYGTNRTLLYRGMEQEESKLLIRRKMDRLIRGMDEETEILRLQEAEEAFCQHGNPVTIRHFFEHTINVKMGKLLPDSQQRYRIVEAYAERFKLSQTLDEVLEIYRDAENFLKRDDGEKQELSKPVRDILLFIQNHYAEDITLDQIARKVDLSRTYVSGLFKKELGVNLTNYITNYRIEKAKELLRETNLKSYEIAEKVGFLDESYFSRSFKKVTGMSPNAYKRGQRP